jgi:Domain of unknown function (DUF4214)/Sulfotransferase family
MWPRALIGLLVRRNSSYFIQTLFQGVLQRDADQEGLAAYTAELRNNGDLAAVAGSIARSDEAWNKNLYANPAGLIEAVFRGILGREPDSGALEAYTEYLSKNQNLATLMSIVCQSQEHWEKLIAEHAEDIVRATFLGILKREPDTEALSVYSAQLRQQRELSALLGIVASSSEYWDILLQEKRHSGQLLQSDNLPSLLAEAVASQKVWNDLSALKFPSRGASSVAFDNDAWVFVHAQKTAGTSLQNMLIDTFGDQNVYREHADTLYMRSPAELSQYCVFAGHFNFDSLSYIPRRRLQLITILRHPKQRLMSLYRFLRAHEPTAPEFNGGIEIANQLDAVEFFRSVLATAASETWNHLTWCIMGQRKWSAYKKALEGLSADALQVQLDVVRLEIRDRLRQFAFIGFQEDFPYSCQRLFELIGARMPHLRHDHSVELLSNNLQYFKYVAKQPVTSDLEAALDPLVQLDNILYREASDIYGLQNGRGGGVGEFRPL